MVESLGNLQKIHVLQLDALGVLNWDGYVPPPQLRYLTLTKFYILPSWVNPLLLPNLIHLEID
jgi:hypothetical protein